MKHQPRTSGEVAALLGATVVGSPDEAVRGVASVSDSIATDVVLVGANKYVDAFEKCPARTAVVSAGVKLGDSAAGRAIIVVPDADVASIALFGAFAFECGIPEQGVHPSAVIHPSAEIDPSSRIGPHVSVGAESTIAPECVIHAGVSIGRGVVIGHGTTIHPNVTLHDRIAVGNSCVIGAGCVIGGIGFGFRPLAGKGLTRIPHIGTVILEDAVEIGSNTTIDRAKTGATIIGLGTKIDNQCQIAHNCKIGRHCAISAHAALAGSVTVGDGVQMGGAVGIADHVTIGSGVQIAAKSGLMRDVPARARVGGTPAVDVRDMLRQFAIMRTLGENASLVSRLLKNAQGSIGFTKEPNDPA
ncbi:MAG: UDP-3-O-(3-hydroxymyristoyl)glucosamine N-acyltransferase [Planctomycetota bacterium]|nr:UDP-3-O-(3-hydroxymyristoyl)glucosamine N-acyltransferase [Planctomycetota bacterium]